MEAILFTAALLIAFAILFFAFCQLFPSIAGANQVFDEIIIESVSQNGYNKSGELTLFWILAASAAVLMILLLYLLQKLKTKEETEKLPLFSTIVLFPLVGHLMIFQQMSIVCVIGLIYFVLVLVYSRKKGDTPAPYLLLPVLSYYSLLAVLTCGVSVSDVFLLSSERIYGITAALTLLIFAISSFFKIDLRRILLFLQIPVPFLLILFFVDSYLYKGTLIRVPYAPFYYVYFGSLLTVFLLVLIFHAKKNQKEAGKLPASRLIHSVTAITVFVYNSWSACPMYAQPDQHHHGEQMIPWQQIVTLGQSAYEEYTPVSGLFPLLNGFIQNVLMGGTVSDYSPAISITVTLFCIVTMYLLCRHVGGAYGLLFAVFFMLPSYNRQYMVLPLLLLLFLPRLLKKPNLWLKVWIFSCFLAGLYYPLYGAAVLAGTMPLGIVMLRRMWKETRWKTELKKPAFYVGWLICLLPIFLCVPLLLRMIKHTLVYSGQTVLADGISLYGQSSPEMFMPYLAGSHETLRLWLYYGFRFFLPILPLAIAGGLLFIVLKGKKKSLSSGDNTSPADNSLQKIYLVCGLLAVIITLSVSYSYTLVRADENVILSRTGPVLLSVMGMFLPVILIKYGKGQLRKSTCTLILGLCFALPLIIYNNVNALKFPQMWVFPNGEASLIMDDSDKLFSYYEVPETFVRMDEIEISDTSMLGEGFMVADQIPYLEQYDSVMQKCAAVTPDTYYMGFDGQGFYYYLNAKACATGFNRVARSYEAQQTIIEQAKEKRPVIFLMDGPCNYYIYYWMITSNYIYCHEDGAFYPEELYAKIYPDGNGGDDYRLYCPDTDFSRTPDSFGSSIAGLLPLFEEEQITLENIKNRDAISINGMEYDCLYLSLKEALLPSLSTLAIQYTCDGQEYENSLITCQTGDGKLLIPLGMNACWLNSENTNITFSLLDKNGEYLDDIPLEQISAIADDCRFLKLKQ